MVLHLVAQVGVAGFGPKSKIKPLRLGFGRTVDGWWVWGFMGSQSPYRANLMCGEFGVSCHVGRGWCCLPWDLHPFLILHLLPTHSTSSSMQLLRTHSRAGHGPIGLVFGLRSVQIEWRRRKDEHCVLCGV